MPYRVVLMSNDDTAPWPLSETAAQQINRLRKRAGLNREQLAARCRDLGAPDNLTAAAIANIETGRPGEDGRRRRELTVEELAVFAAALGVPPVLLVAPVGLRDLAEVLPGHIVSSWDAAQWFTGEAPLPTRHDEGDVFVTRSAFQAWETGAAPLDYHRQLDALFSAWRRAETEGRAEIERQIGELRRAMRRAGVRTGAMTPDLAHIDEEGAPDGSTENPADPGR